MKNESYIRHTFIRQQGQNDCGVACLRMLLNYSGKRSGNELFKRCGAIPGGGLSLLGLRNLAISIGMNARNVSMSLQYLRQIESPCILHMTHDEGNGHFQVCYRSGKKRGKYYYLMADPAKFVYRISEDELDKKWVSKSALYFQDLTRAKVSGRPAWMVLLSGRFFPKLIWLSVPFLGICTTFFGIAFSWVLQKGIDDPLAGKRAGLVFATISLLLIMMLFKGLLSYLKQRIQIALNMAVNNQLYKSLIQKVGSEGIFSSVYVKTNVNKFIVEIQKIQNALNSFIAVLLSEGALLIFSLIGLFFWLPLAGAINTLFTGISILITSRSLPELTYDYAHLNELSGDLESLLKAEQINDSAKPECELRNHTNKVKKRHHEYLQFSKQIAVRISRLNLLYDCLAAINVMLVFIFGIRDVKDNLITYPTFMLLVIFSFLISSLIIRICNAFYSITDGAEAFRQFTANLSD